MLTVGQSVNLVTRMEVSTVAETITVSARPTVETTRSAVANTLDQRTVENTPILGRKFEDLLTLTPGVSVVQGPDGDEITFAGQRGIFNNVSLDGGDYNNGFFGEQVGGQRAAVDITLEAVKEFQVIANGAPAEFGRTAGGVVNVVTKSGTNELHGNLFYFQRLESLTGELSDGTTLDKFHREQFGGTVGGPLSRDRLFYFAAVEGIAGNFERPNLSRAIGTPCPVAAPNIRSDEALINGSADCQRLALLGFIRLARGSGRITADRASDHTAAILLKTDAVLSLANRLARLLQLQSLAQGERDVRRRHLRHVGERHRRRSGAHPRHQRELVLDAVELDAQRVPLHLLARESPAQGRRIEPARPTRASGFGPTFRFGNPFFLQPGVDEHLWRVQLKNNLSWVKGRHTMKVGGEWLHTMNDQVFRGFFTGRYLFDSVSGFLRYASPAAPGGFGPSTVACSNGSYVTAPHAVSRGQRRRAAVRCSSICRARDATARPPTRRARRASRTTSSRCSRRISGRCVRT